MGNAVRSNTWHPSVDAVGGESPDPWMSTTVCSDKTLKDHLEVQATGFRRINFNTVVNQSKNHETTFAIRWSRGFCKGRHIFEISFPTSMRGNHASVGIANKMAPTYLHKSAALVGETKDSWGIDLVTSRTVHNGKEISKYPKGDRHKLPDRFYMYIDIPERKLLFGADGIFYGCAFSGMDIDGQTVYPMLSATSPGATVTMVYRGKGVIVTGPIRKTR
ncbi:SPRY domain-containing SOCS box protein 2-like [Mizuhopecten yessoensis]|uniref:SPRY domain-containing SOCS box protein 2 n=1 Tax=Mizuhopecten yessoensis TaxID=6573 RepID=A0A210QCN9_MIZYE|nr:SPRY domain-containing SOCS box protein 2-like [Mizuhopecten yessoensis]OWF46527.1 SPRY domain-containing SOCS box protein 2 [Mizuhopecten yessoensis]